MKLAVLAAAAALVIAAPAWAQALRLSGVAGQTATVTLAELAALPHVHVEVKQNGQAHAFDGVLLGDLLAKVGAPRGEAIRGAELASAVRFTSVDGYQVVLALADTDSLTRKGRVLIADHDGGEALKPGEGPFRLVIEDDLKPARSARQIERIEVLRLATTPVKP